MKKNYLFFVMLMLMGMTWGGAKAALWEQGEVKTSFADGDLIILTGATTTSWWTSGSWVDGWGKSAALLESCVIQLEATGETGPVKNMPTYYLKQKSTGKYFASGLVDDKSDAYPFEILVAADSAGVSFYNDELGTKTQLTKTSGADENSIVLCYTYIDSDDNVQKTDFLATGGSAPTIWGYYDTNAWFAYTAVESDDPYTELSNLLTYYNAFTTNGKLYIGGNNPGNYPQALVDNFYNSLTAGETALEDEDIDACRTAIAQINDAKAALDTATIVPMRAGYFYVQSANRLFYQKQSVYKGIYANTSGRFAWKTLDERDPSFVWEVTDAGSGNFLFKNLQTGEYISAVDATNYGQTSKSVPSTYETFVSLGYSQYNIKVGSATMHTNNHSSGAGVASTITTWSGGLSSGSAWYMHEVTDTQLLDSLKSVVAQLQLTSNYKSLLSTATAAYGKANLYTATSVNTDKPLITVANDTVPSKGQVFSNAKQSTEGTYAALIDGDYTTYFHSRWSGTSVAENHYLQFDLLANPVSEFSFRTSRRVSNNNNRPTNISIFATNDTTSAGSWTFVQNITTGLPTVSTDTTYNGAVKMDQSYRYLRFVVNATNNAALFGDYPYFTYSEFQIYPAEVSYAETAQAPRMGSVVSELLTALNEASATLKTGSVTQTDYDQLNTAYTNFMAAYVDTTAFTKLLAECDTVLAVAEEGDEIGYFKEGSIATFTAAVDAAKSVELISTGGVLITREALDNAYNTLLAAKNAFYANLNSVESGKWYYIINAQDPSADESRYGQAIYSTGGNTTSGLAWAGATGGTLDDATYTNPKYMWRFVQTTDSTYSVQNLASGYYMGDVVATSSQYKQKATPVDYKIKYVGTKRFTIAPAGTTGREMHAQVSGSTVVAWAYDDTATSGSQWTFEPVDVDNIAFLTLSFTENTINGVTRPFPIDGLTNVDGDEYKMYEICGKVTDGDTVVGLKLKQITRAEAGVPFIVEIGDRTQYSSDGTSVDVIAYVDMTSDFDAVDSPKSKNGLIGAFTSVSVPFGTGLFEEGKLRVAKSAEVVMTDAAYVNEAQIEETGTEDAILYIGEGEPALNEIGGVAVDGNTLVDVYTSGGVLVAKSVKASEAFKGLKKGIYIVGKTKVSVK